MTGKASQNFGSSKVESKPQSEDFDFEESLTGKQTTSSSKDEEDFFSDF